MDYPKSIMKNPFEYGGIVAGDSFCNRSQELRDIVRAMENGENLFLYSERRIGKTSLVLKALDELPKSEFRHVYIDLWPTDSEASFIAAYAKAVTQAFVTTADKMLEFGKKFFGALRPTVGIDSQGSPQVTFTGAADNLTVNTLDQILDAAVRAAESSKLKVVIVLDEFQQVLEYDSDLVERRLRSTIQKQDDVSYIFLGSRKHLIQKMVTDNSRPLYRAGSHYPLHSIALKHWQPFIKARFQSSNRNISSESIRSVFELTQGHPFYTQHLCHAIWESTDEGSSVSESIITESIRILLKREDYAYSTLWDSLAGGQRKFLEALAAEAKTVEPFSAAFIGRHGLKGASQVQKAAKVLLERDLIDHEGGAYFISDRFFRLWLQEKLKTSGVNDKNLRPILAADDADAFFEE